ncbi:methyl-accepting chemotaxis protein [Thorsellia anophelis]|uniref:Methyl-accepting chemotaxis sensory transducer with TarH sensor n=1 Tax=Thorsellia anophelis DSM 18579 TaxID=1123402 RepID=A0A1I0DVU1_9GAMM|nr:methyl-accepting chemotaxis protein [Thorsellia anophelis]SET36758.1 methyl-accepting chemotaxis sensory transducer with TarH sensor [Thorsellia anophelis DSM 18579]
MFKKINITTSMSLLIVIFVVVHLISSFVAVIRSEKSDDNFSTTVVLNNQIDELALARRNVIQSRVEAYRAASSAIEENTERFNQDLEKAVKLLNIAEQDISRFVEIKNPIPANQVAIDKVKSTFDVLYADLRNQQEALNKDGFKAYRAIDASLSQEKFAAASDEFLTIIAGQLNDFDETSVVDHNRAVTQFVIELILLAALLIFSLWWTRTIVKKPMEDLLEQFNHIANGDLTQRPYFSGNNEISKLYEYFTKMQQYLINTVIVVRDSSHVMVKGVENMAMRNDELSARTEEQASSLQETAASMEELTATVKLNADNARSASELAQASTKTAIKGGEITETVVITMKDITESSQKIGAITSVIDGIAFQTNILALNAAVEAARAGEQGRGFAVVAGEVRNLAQRSAQAAREIKQLIDESITRVNLGSELVENAGNTIQEIVQSVAKVNDIMGEISSASDEQSRGIQLVSQAVNQMDQVTQENGSLVHELASSAKELEYQAAHLSDAVSLFKINQDAVHTPI